MTVLIIRVKTDYHSFTLLMATPPELLRIKLSGLIRDFIPDAAIETVVNWIVEYKINLTVTERRQSIYGDYRNPNRTTGHRISVNGDLNKYAFLITFVHEMAHLIVWEHHRNHVRSHGREWKIFYRQLMNEFLLMDIFPEDVKAALRQHINKPVASGCVDNHLAKALSRYNIKPTLHVEDLSTGELFKIPNGKIFRLDNKVRKRFRCVEIKTNAIYLINAMAEVERVQHNLQTI